MIAAGTAVALLLCAFVGRGGLSLGPQTNLGMGLELTGALLCAAALLHPRARAIPKLGTATLFAFALFTAYTAGSIIWSLAPSDSWLESNRTVSYLAAFAGGTALARLAPRHAGALLHGIWIAAVAISAWALITKVFPGALSPEEIYARLRAPFDYWNAVGLMAALGIPPLLWLGARRSGHAPLGALAWPGIALLEVCLMLSYSRGALLAAGIALAGWFIVVPLRLRSAVVLAGATAGAAPIVAWAFSSTALTTDGLPIDVRTDAGHELGALLLLMLSVWLGIGLAIHFWTARRPPSIRTRRRMGGVFIGALVLVVVAGVIGIATAPGGVSGQVSKTWDQMTNPNAGTPANTPNRLTATSSVRARYWDEAFKVQRVQPWVGTGAGAYATVRTRFRTGTLFVRQAHGYVPQTLADLGWVGMGLSLLLLVLWATAASRATGLRLRDRGLPWDAERVTLVALVAVAVVFGVHSTVDWTWFVPANAVCGLLAAGWVAGRVPLRARIPLGARPAAELGIRPGALTAEDGGAPGWPAGVERGWTAQDMGAAWAPGAVAVRRPWTPAFADVGGPGSRPGIHAAISDLDWRRRPRIPVPAAAGAAVVVLLALAAMWSTLQPLRSAHADDIAITRLELGQLDAAASVARIAHDRNPLSTDPLWELAFIEQLRGRLGSAEDALQQAVRLQPANAEAWRRLGRFQLSVLNRPAEALTSMRAAYYLDPQDPGSTSDYLEAARAVQAAGATP